MVQTTPDCDSAIKWRRPVNVVCTTGDYDGHDFIVSDTHTTARCYCCCWVLDGETAAGASQQLHQTADLPQSSDILWLVVVHSQVSWDAVLSTRRRQVDK